MAQRRNQGQGAAQPQGTVRGHLRAAAGTVASRFADRISGPTQRSRKQGTQRQPNTQQHTGQKDGIDWNIPVSERLALPLNRGDIATFFQVLPEIEIHDSFVAGTAGLHYFGMHRRQGIGQDLEHDLERALNDFHRNRMTVYASQKALDDIRQVRDEGQLSSSPKGRLSAQFLYYEAVYLRLIHGYRPKGGLRKLIADLTAIADNFQEEESDKRQACVRLVLADVCLMQGYFLRRSNRPESDRYYKLADYHMAQALQCAGRGYTSKELGELGTAFMNGARSSSRQPVGAFQGAESSVHESGTDDGLRSDEMRS